MAKERQVRFSERLIQAMGQAAGVAHALNNPLSVISGRAQLLVDGEEDETRLKDLDRIQESAGAVSAVIDDLMSCAEPSRPRPAGTDVRQIVDEAVQLAGQKSGVDHVNAQVQAQGDSHAVVA